MQTLFLKRARANERECDGGSQAALQLTKKEHEAFLNLTPPCLPTDSGDLTIQMRAMNTDTEHHITVKELEIQALRIAILQKYRDLARLKDTKMALLKHTDDHLQDSNRTPYLPVEIILHIFGLLYYLDSVSYEFYFMQDLPLYKISMGFADLPGWQKAIQAQIPLVLAKNAREWKSTSNWLSVTNQVTLGHHVRVCNLDDLPSLAQLGATGPTSAYLAIDDAEFINHLATAKHFRLNSLILSASSLENLFEGLRAANGLVSRIKSLEALVDIRYLPPGASVQEQFQPSQQIEFTDPCLQHACLPWSALRGCLSLLTHVTILELFISSKEHGYNVSNLLESFRLLPKYITHLTLRLRFRATTPYSPQDFDNLPLFSNLVELTVDGFDSFTTNLLIKGLDGPNLQSLAAKPDHSYLALRANLPDELSSSTLGSKDIENKLQLDFLETVHRKFPRLHRLKYASPCNFGTLYLHSLIKPDATEGVDGKRGWLLPTLEVLDIQDDEEDILDLVIALASARLKSDEVSSLRSVSFPSLARRSKRERDIADVWRGTQLNALRVLVPDLKIVSGLSLEV